MKNLLIILLVLIIVSPNSLKASKDKISDEILLKQTLYALKEGDFYKEITSDILAQKGLPDFIRQKFIEQKRRFFVFLYPSDGLKVKSMVSFIEGSENEPLIFLLRGASRMEALPAFLYPSKEVLFCSESKATIIAGCYRDGVSEGVDEYGGEDINDVYHLTLHLPKVLDKLNTKVDKKRRYMIGISRGGMQMFLALAKFPALQTYFDKFVSFSGILNIDLFASNNPDWCRKMEKNFGFDRSQAWLDRRNPILAIPKITNKQLPFLLIQGAADPKVRLYEGYSMLQVLRTNQFTNVSYWEVEGGDHALKNHPEYIKLILLWLEL
jgi:dipeptidyl aminopeptidase/acylaminoacyl peptidase